MTVDLLRRGALEAPHNSVDIEVMSPSIHTPGWVTYWGAAWALVAAGCATEVMVAKRKRGAPKPLDERGERFIINRYPTKAHERLSIRRTIGDYGAALDLPGVRDLFPDGFPAVEPTEPLATTAAQWKADELDRFDQDVRAVAAWFEIRKQRMRRADSRFQLAPCDVQRLEAMIGKFSADMLDIFAAARVVDNQRAFLRLVVNDDPAAGAGVAFDEGPHYG